MLALSRRLALVLAAGFAFAGPAAADTFKLRIAAGHTAGAIWIGVYRDFFVPRTRDRVKAETGHTIEWTEAYGGSVCKLGECLEAVESGLVDVADVLVPFEPAKLMPFNFSYFVPFGATSSQMAGKAILATIDQHPELKKLLEDKYNQVFIGVGAVGNYGLVTSFPWERIADAKGRKVGAAGPNIPWLEGTGIVGVQMTLNEAYTSLQSGVYEGVIMYPDGIVGFKLHEVAKNYMVTDLGATIAPMLTMNKDSFRSLPPQVQKIFLEVGREFTEVLTKAIDDRSETSLKAMTEAGVAVRQLSAEEKKAWTATMPNLPKIRTADIQKTGFTGDVIYTYIRELKKLGHTFPRDWEAER